MKTLDKVMLGVLSITGGFAVGDSIQKVRKYFLTRKLTKLKKEELKLMKGVVEEVRQFDGVDESYSMNDFVNDFAEATEGCDWLGNREEIVKWMKYCCESEAE